jgi:type IV secretion system protein VirD4
MQSNGFSRNGVPANPARGGHGQQLLLGWSSGQESFDLLPGPGSRQGNDSAVTYDGDAPLLTFAPTGAGKGRGVLIPNALLHDGPLVAIDPKGEITACCARQRQRLGQKVAVLDPFHVVTERSSGLNPLDLLDLPGSAADSDAEMLASLLAAGHEFAREPFWNDTANWLVEGLIAHIATTEAPKNRHLGRVREWLFASDLTMSLARLLDTNGVRSRMAAEKFISYLEAPDHQTRPSIITTARTYFNALSSESVAATLRASTFSLRDVLEGRPLSIFIVIPPDKLESHKPLLRLWVGTLLTTVMRRPHIPRQRTLFLIDEAAQLGTLPALRTAVTLLRGSGLQVWSFWQDMSQLRQLYPEDWQTMVNNSAVVQAFGVNNHQMAREWSELFGRPASELSGMRPEQAIVQVQGQGCHICRRPDYLRDPQFKDLYDPNPRFALQAQPGRPGGR